MNYNSQTLIDIQFLEIGEWIISESGNNISYSISDKSVINIPNILYSFIVKSKETDFIGYIGKTSKSIKNRFQGYINPGADQSTNIRVSKNIIESLKEGKMVFIYVLLDIEPLQWGNFSINLPAGLEDSIVHKLKPTWNIAGVKGVQLVTSTEELEEDLITNQTNLSESDPALAAFKIKLGEAYYNKGILNAGVKASDYLGLDGETITLVLPNGQVLSSKIDRRATSDGSVRAYFGKDLSNWYQQNYQYGETLTAFVKLGNKIVIG